MRVISAALLLALFVAVGCESQSGGITGRFATAHVVVAGNVTQLPSNSPVSAALVVVGVRQINCSSPAAGVFHLTTQADGSFGNRLEFLSPGGPVCITFDVRPSGSTDVQRGLVTVENVRVAPSTSPPETLRVTIALPAQ